MQMTLRRYGFCPVVVQGSANDFVLASNVTAIAVI
jgi:hypothetical protein